MLLFRWFYVVFRDAVFFVLICHRNLEVMMFVRKMKNYMVCTLISGGLNVAIPLAVGMLSEFHMFSQVRFL